MPRVYDWDLFHEELAEMYLVHNMQLKDIMIDMSTRHNFNPRYVALSIFKYIYFFYETFKESNTIQSTHLSTKVC